MTHKGTVTLETERLILRRFAAKDAEAVFRNWANDPDVTKYLTWTPHGTLENTKALIDGWVNSYSEPDKYGWAIELKAIGEPIGSIAVVEAHYDIAKVHIGYCIGKFWWNKGYTSEALAEVIRFLFEEVGANRIEAAHDTRNPSSGKVMAKCGMILEGTHRQAFRNTQGICDETVYAILAEDYRKDNML